MEEPHGIMPTLCFLIQGAKTLCLGIVVTVSDIYLGQLTSAISQSTNPQITTTVSRATHSVRAGLFHHVPWLTREPLPSEIWEVISVPTLSLAQVLTPFLSWKSSQRHGPSEATQARQPWDGRASRSPFLILPPPPSCLCYGCEHLLWWDFPCLWCSGCCGPQPVLPLESAA